jgi:hypothetical protein
MQKIIGLFLLLFSVSTLAHIYCPSQVICEEAAQVDSCHFEQTLRGFWQWVPGKRTQPVLAGIYYHTYASAPDVNDASGYAICVYTHEAMAQTLSLRAQPGFNIVADLLPHAGWRREEFWWECVPEPAEVCPMGEM